MFFAKPETSEVSETSEVCNQSPLFTRHAKRVLAEAEIGNSRFIRAARWRPARRVGATIELVGTEAMPQLAIASTLADQLQRPVEAEVISLEAWERVARASGLGDYQVLTLLKMFGYYERYGFSGNPQALTCLLGRQPTSFAEFVERIKNDFRVG